MRIATGTLLSAFVLLAFGAIGAVGSWAVVGGTVLALLGAVSLAIQLEARDSVDAGMAAFLEHR